MWETPETEQRLGRVLDAIGRVHGDGPLPKLPITERGYLANDAQGQYAFWGNAVPIKPGRDTRANAPAEIKIKTSAEARHMTLAHELGHFLDHAGIGRKSKEDPYPRQGEFPTDAKSGGMANVMATIKESRAYRTLRTHAVNARLDGVITIPRGEMGGRPLPPISIKVAPDWFNYVIGQDELWARSYAQYIAVRSGDAELMAELRRKQATMAARWNDPNHPEMPTQWTDDDFEPIARAIDDLFVSLGWRDRTK